MPTLVHTRTPRFVFDLLPFPFGNAPSPPSHGPVTSPICREGSPPQNSWSPSLILQETVQNLRLLCVGGGLLEPEIHQPLLFPWVLRRPISDILCWIRRFVQVFRSPCRQAP